jgi:hypothetical protein
MAVCLSPCVILFFTGGWQGPRPTGVLMLTQVGIAACALLVLNAHCPCSTTLKFPHFLSWRFACLPAWFPFFMGDDKAEGPLVC